METKNWRKTKAVRKRGGEINKDKEGKKKKGDEGKGKKRGKENCEDKCQVVLRISEGNRGKGKRGRIERGGLVRGRREVKE